MPTNIPEARKQLAAIADEVQDAAPSIAEEIRFIIRTMMIRQQTGRKAPRQRRAITSETIASVKKMAADYPEMTQEEIGRHHHVDGGRVSEILAGLRT